MSAESNTPENAFSRLLKIEQEYQKLEEVCKDSEKRIKAIELIIDTIRSVDQDGLVSKNEEINDYSTASLKFIFLNFYLGKFFASSNSPETTQRVENLKLAEDSFTKYIETCQHLRLLHDSEIKYFVDYVSILRLFSIKLPKYIFNIE